MAASTRTIIYKSHKTQYNFGLSHDRKLLNMVGRHEQALPRSSEPEAGLVYLPKVV